MDESPDRLRIITIAGASRSGSTLLSLLLAAAPDTVAVGELRYIWSRGLTQNMLCGCGVPFRACPFWRDVFTDAYGGIDDVPLAELTHLHNSVAPIWRLPRLARSRRAQPGSPTARYIAHLDRLCRSITMVAGAHTIIDSSKLPSFCALLGSLPDTDATLVQLVRDPRAVAFSFSRKRLKPDVHWTRAYMTRFGPVRSAFDWDVLNLSAELASGPRLSRTLIRYEDLARDPAGELARSLPRLRAAAAVGAGGVASLPISHTVSGNPLRFDSGPTRIRLDAEWKERMRPRDRRIVSALTWPMLHRYGYLTTDPSP